MAYTTINKSTDYFNTITYTGNGTSSTARTVGFDPDWIWVKNRGGTDNHYLMDKVRGLDYNLETNNADAQARDYLISGTTSTGWTSSNSGEINANSGTFVAWNWKANGTGSANTDGTINTTSTSVNTTAGFSISKYTGTGSSGATIGHGLGVKPKVIIVKRLESGNWFFQHGSLGATKNMVLNSTNAVATFTACWNDTEPTSSVFTVGNDNDVNASGGTYVAYCFAEKTGYSKFGSFTGNGSTDGPFIYTGFKPSFVIAKESSSTGHWRVRDNKRMTAGNPIDKLLRPDQTNAEQTEDNVDFLSNGFKMRTTGGENNGSGDTYIYMAFGQSMVGTNNVPVTAR